MPTCTVRRSTLYDASFLREMLYEAVCWRPDTDHPPIDEVLSNPDVSVIIDGWGRKGDVGLVAEVDGSPVGAIWYRLWTEDHHTYGFVNASIPEVGIGILLPYRRKGIGTLLFDRLHIIAGQAGYAQLSLSVEKENPAQKLYLNQGFCYVHESEEDYIMICDL